MMTNEHYTMALADEIERAVRLRIIGTDERFLTDEENAQVISALRATPPAARSPAETADEIVAWRWRPHGATNWIYDPTQKWILEQGDEIEVQPLYVRPAGGGDAQGAAPLAYRLDHPTHGIELSILQPNEDWAGRGWNVTPLYAALRCSGKGATAMSPEQIELARHALGLPNNRRQSYRNNFVCGKGHPDYDNWQALVAAGLAKRRDGSTMSGGDDVFWLTKEGAKRALKKYETLCPEDFRAPPSLAGGDAQGTVTRPAGAVSTSGESDNG